MIQGIPVSVITKARKLFFVPSFHTMNDSIGDGQVCELILPMPSTQHFIRGFVNVAKGVVKHSRPE